MSQAITPKGLSRGFAKYKNKLKNSLEENKILSALINYVYSRPNVKIHEMLPLNLESQTYF